MLLHLSYQSPSEGGPASSGAHWLDAGLSGPQRQRGTMMSPSLAFVLHGSTLICSMVPLKNSMFSTPFGRNCFLGHDSPESPNYEVLALGCLSRGTAISS